MSSARRGPEIDVRRGLTSLAWIRWLNKRVSQRLAVGKGRAGRGGGELRRDRSGRTDAFFCPAQPRCLCLCLCRSRCDHAMRPTFSLRASHLIARGAPPVLCTCSRGKVLCKLKDILNRIWPVPSLCLCPDIAAPSPFWSARKALEERPTDSILPNSLISDYPTCEHPVSGVMANSPRPRDLDRYHSTYQVLSALWLWRSFPHGMVRRGNGCLAAWRSLSRKMLFSPSSHSAGQLSCERLSMDGKNR
jgi:hypothetical protein